MNRILALHKSTNPKPNFDISIKSLYKHKQLLSIDHIPLRHFTEHTMFNALDFYVEQKLPCEELLSIAQTAGTIEIHGLYPRHFELLYDQEIAENKITEISFYHKPTTRKYNVVRPRFFINREESKIIICVAPGSDYVQHYGTMVRHLIYSKKLNLCQKLYLYPTVSETLSTWTQLDEDFVSPQDILILGYVEEVHSYVTKALNLIPLSTRTSPYFESRRYKLPSGDILNFLGVNFSFWGNISRILVNSVCRNGAQDIYYFGKLGSLTNPDSLYKDLFCPSKFIHLNHTNVVASSDCQINNFLKAFPHLDTGAHVSVPTVLEEDFLQRELANKFNAQSIDNEISQMAIAVNNYNQEYNTNISFTSLHFATDYVRSLGEKDILTPHDLSNNRHNDAVSKKEFAILNIARYFIEYLRSL